MFVGRQKELDTLNRLYDSGRFQFPVIYGRRRVGKTTLINEFSKGKDTVFFTAIESDAQSNLANLSRAVYAVEHPDADPALARLFLDFQSAFQRVFELAQERRLVFVIDEYSYLAKADPSVSSILQMLIDRNKDANKLCLILCGSSLSFMREQVLGEKSPLYGRRTAQIELKPLDFVDIFAFFPKRSAEDVFNIYAMTGGVPLYLEQFPASGAAFDDFEEVFCSPSSVLYEEPTNLLKQEVQKASRYNAIIAAIASGKTANNEIAQAAGTQTTELTYYLRELQDIGLVVRRQPIVNAKRNAIYTLADNLFAFWYRFIMPNRALVERGMATRVRRIVEDGFSEYADPLFEDVCKQWLWQELADGRLDIDLTDIGSWWGNDAQTRSEAEIDIAGVSQKRVVLLGECKWRNEKFPASEIEKLKERRRLVSAEPDAVLYGFSKSGFASGCRDIALENARVRLVEFEEMFERKRKPHA